MIIHEYIQHFIKAALPCYVTLLKGVMSLSLLKQDKVGKNVRK